MFDMNPEAGLTAHQARRLDAVREAAAQLNAAIRDAVDAGLAVELTRAARHHSGQGCWGDQMRAMVVKC
ncbi:hypothetical protein [Rubellimicrobium sp. CFH 75288]|uniref:hypothetical protein n=1 Tax=Rubellimicrobium sp. CFH 75288 TaxID=2697034 RepID=UPI001411CC38|nr:hypothetical protein [Rubellimicrobium sp. CFH 75288]NAZ38129.1 hypothetical protein [Rubellimicrobium sp. CFH 75288]